MWDAVNFGSDYAAEFEAAIHSLQVCGARSGVEYSSHWPLELRRRTRCAPKRRVLVLGKATNGFAQLHPTCSATSADFARRAGASFDPLPGGNYTGGFWNFLVGPSGVFQPGELDAVSLVWSNLYKVGRGYNHRTAGRPLWLGATADVPEQRTYTPRQSAPDGGVDNNPTSAERRAQGRERMLRLLRREIEVCSPDVVLCVCRPWLVEATRGTPWEADLLAKPSIGVGWHDDFLGTGSPAVVGRHPIRVSGGLLAYASTVRSFLAQHDAWCVDRSQRAA